MTLPHEDRTLEIDLGDLDTGSDAPEAVTEQPDLSFEKHAESRWLPDVMGMRMIAVAMARTARRRRGDTVVPIPWLPILGTCGAAALLVVAVWAFGEVLT